MTYLSRVFVAMWLCTAVNMALATEAPDNIVKNAMGDLVRYEQQSAALSSTRKSGVKRVLKLMTLSYERLQSSPNRDHEVWQATEARYSELKEKLESMLNPSTSNTASTSSPAKTNSSNTNQAATTTNSTSQPATKSTPSSVPALVSGQRVRVKKLTKDITNVTAAIVTTGPSELQNGNNVQSIKKRFDQFVEALKRYPQADDPDVIAATAAFSKLQRTLQSEYSRAQQQLASLGDVQVRLRTLQDLLAQHPAPTALVPPFDTDAANEWVQLASKSRTVAEHAHGQLLEIAEGAYLPATQGLPNSGALYERQDVDRLISFAQSLFQRIQETYGGMSQSLKNQMDQLLSELDTRWQEDPDSDKRWMFLDEQRQVEAYQMIDRAMSFGNSYIALESALNRDASAGDKLIERASRARSEFDANRKVALSTSRMPEPASTDASMLQIAESIVANPDYEFGEAGSIVLTTSDIVTRERKDSEIDIDDVDVSASGDVKLSGTETTWTYKWKEFKFAVPLKEVESNEWHIWWITAKNFSSGGNRTPIGRWISGSTTRGNLILEEYI